jgi:hypothetical protein
MWCTLYHEGGALFSKLEHWSTYQDKNPLSLETLQKTPKFSWAGLFSSAGLRKYNVIFVGKSDRRKCVLFSWANEDFRRQAHENTIGIFVGLGTDETVCYFRRPQLGRRK